MGLLRRFTFHSPSPRQLVIRRHPGLLFLLFITVYLSGVVAMDVLFVLVVWDVRSPQTLTCRSQSQSITCDYRVRGSFSGKTVQIRDVKQAILSEQPNGDRIVLTTSQPWVALEATENNSQTVQQINQGLAQLRQRGQTWQIDLYPPAASWQGAILFLGAIGLFFTTFGLAAFLSDCAATFEFDADRNTVTLTKLGMLRSYPAPFTQLLMADSKPLGYLGFLSDKLGIYGGDADDRQLNRVIRLVFTTRRPLTFTQAYYRQSQELVARINAFVAAQKQ